MNVVMIGSGYVGLVSSACFAEFGACVTCVDIDNKDVMSSGQVGSLIYEPALDDYIRRNVSKGQLFFSIDLKSAISNADIVFITQGIAAYHNTDQEDLEHLYTISKEIAQYLCGYTVIVDKIVMGVGASCRMKEIICKENSIADFDVASNPEFLRRGSAIGDFLRPERVILGVDSYKAEKVLRALYRPLNLIEAPFHVTSLENAEIIKLASNAFLATKVSFINEISNLCEKVGGDIRSVAKGMGIDERIGNKFLYAGPGYGGPSFSKATSALISLAHGKCVSAHIVNSTVKVNELQKLNMVKKIKTAILGLTKGCEIAVLGLTFKPETDDMRDSPSLAILPALVDKGAIVKAHDPEGVKEAKKILPEAVQFVESIDDAIQDADAIVLMTEWNQYRGLDLAKVKAMMKGNVFIDLRNVYEKDMMEQHGFEYTCVGR